MAAKPPLCFLATFPDPNRTTSQRGGYRRNVEMLHLLQPHFDLTLAVAATAPFSVDVGPGIASTVIAASRMPVRWIRTLRFIRQHCSRQTTIVVYNPTLHTLPALWLRRLGYTVIVDYVDIQGTVVESENPLLRRLGVLIEHRFVHTCRHFITSSTVIAERIRALNRAANVFLYRGTYQPPEERSGDDAAIDPDDTTVKILYLGMMHDFSGVRELVRAFIDLDAPNAHLYLAGHGPVKQQCVEMAARRAPGKVSFPELDDAHLHPFMQRMDILAVPYLDAPRNRANFPSKIIEYLWAGKAILGTQVGEICHALDHERTALLVAPDEAGLHAGLHRLLDDRELRKRLGSNARREFATRYHPTVVGEALRSFVTGAGGPR